MNPDEFICPECGSHKAGQQTFVSTIPDEAIPWSCILQRYECGGCRMTIPAHLAERWEGMSVEAAQKEWREIYRGAKR